MSGAVFIDVDRTLINGDSFRAFVLDQVFKSRRLGLSPVCSAYLKRRIGLLSVESFKEQCLAGFVGASKQQLESIGDSFNENWLAPRVRPGVNGVLDACHANGRKVVLISGSIDLYIKSLSASLGLDNFVSTELRYDQNGDFLGGFVGGDCVGSVKTDRARQFAEAHNLSLQESTYYGDSAADLDFMQQVGQPVAIWPDRVLKDACSRNGWPVEYW